MNDFTDFWSKNGWLVQYFHHEGVVGESFIITPTEKPPYRSCDRYKGWTVTALQDWFTELDEATCLTTVLPQSKAPALDVRIFPAPDGKWYAAWPPMPEQQPDQIYVLVRRFSLHPSWLSWDWQEKAEASRLAHTQDQLAQAGRLIWRTIQRERKG